MYVCVLESVKVHIAVCLQHESVSFLKNLNFSFPARRQIDEWMPRSFKKRFPNTRIINDCYEIECQ